MAHEYRATVKWTRGDAKFTDQRYSRGHSWTFDGGSRFRVVLAAQRAPALFGRQRRRSRGRRSSRFASCRMLTFLTSRRQAGIWSSIMRMMPVGVMSKNERGSGFPR
jgi:hypothetical protein